MDILRKPSPLVYMHVSLTVFICMYVCLSVCFYRLCLSFCLFLPGSLCLHKFLYLPCYNVCLSLPFCHGKHDSGVQGIYMLCARHGRYSVVLLLSLLWKFYRIAHYMSAASMERRRSNANHRQIIFSYRQSTLVTGATAPEHEAVAD